MTPPSQKQTSLLPRIRTVAKPSGAVVTFGGIMKITRLLVDLFGFLLLLTLCGSALAQTAPTAPILLKEAPLGTVKFDHTPHLKVAGKCEVCHHTSKPQKPPKASQEACNDCHTNPATPPVTTKLQAAFYSSSATTGLCIDCHRTENSQGKAAPVKCADCHSKANT
jgi:Class III cytochrome C family